jgi:ABC-2 type transport system ATP-binding protein
VAALVLDGVTKEYGAVRALDDITLRVGRESIHCLAGPNGSGKTTCCRIALGLTRPSAGRVGRPDATIGVGFQSPNVYDDLTVRENLATFDALQPGPAEWQARVVEALRLDRVAHRPARALSDGYRKKLDLAIALSRRPDVLLLDEPLADVDDHSADRLLELLATERNRGTAILVSTHQLAAFEPIADRLTVLHDGTVVRDADIGAFDGGLAAAAQEAVRTAEES